MTEARHAVRRSLRRATAVTVAACSLAATVPATASDGPAAETATSFLGAFKQGETSLSLRYRFETVSDDRFAERAEASTLRTALVFRTAAWNGWRLVLEAEDVTAVPDDDDYANAGAGGANNGVTGVPVVADPDLTEVNQAHLAWQGARWRALIGRQEINLADQRFVGAVGWRQNHQSFDALRLIYAPGERLRVDYTFAHAVNRIFGDRLRMASHVLDLPIKVGSAGELRPYGLLLDYDDDAFHPLSTLTVGLGWSDRRKLRKHLTLSWRIEGAVQEDAADNPLAVDTDFTSLSLGAELGPVGVEIGRQALGDAGSGSRAFQTPLATLHKWNGWADRFLVTPADGLDDRYLRIAGRKGDRLRWSVTYHRFAATRGGAGYGDELDADVVYTAPWKQAFALKLARFEADAPAGDTEKLMVWTQWRF